MLTCIVNISEGSRAEAIDEIAKSAGSSLLDVHSDPWHNRSVFSLGGPDVLDASKRVARSAWALIDSSRHVGVHPRLGAVDVVPFVPMSSYEHRGSVDLEEALLAREEFAHFAADECGVPCFFYGPERSLPDIRHHAFRGLSPDVGPLHPHPRAGACCVGARSVLVAYNLWLESTSLEEARNIARALRSNTLRCLAFSMGGATQISCNLVDPWTIGPAQAFDAVAARASIERGELVGLLPEHLLDMIPASRWLELGLASDMTLESRIAR